MYAACARLIASGSYAVDLFIIISGFVIMLGSPPVWWHRC